MPTGLRITFYVSRFTPAFTLIELILVMSILTIAVAFTAPALANFFHGRALDSEARRLLSLTHQGQSRAVSEGLPMELWLDTAGASYGLEADSSFETKDSKAETFSIDKDVQLEVLNMNPFVLSGGAEGDSSESKISASTSSKHANLPRIRFLPDGTVSESSPRMLKLAGRDGVSLLLMLSRNRLQYAITNQPAQ
jgi:prepilin-type N-terminal cleavage/methylation domain-containing protein